MWGCNFYSNIHWMKSFFYGGFLYPLIFVLLIVLLIYLLSKVLKLQKKGKTSKDFDRKDSLEILKIRYAKGQIDREEFETMRSVVLEEQHC